MSHIEVYRINGRLYKYRVWNKRVGKKVKHKKKYLGPVERVMERRKGRERKPGGGRKPTLFVGKLGDAEKKALEKALSSSSAFTKERAKTILASSEGKSVKDIASAVGKEKRSVRNAIKDFNKKGLACLKKGKTTGRKPVFSAGDRAVMLALASTDPAKVGEAFTSWSLPKLKRHLLEQKKLSISVEQLRQVLRKQGFRLKKSRKWQYSNDPDFVKKNLK